MSQYIYNIQHFIRYIICITDNKAIRFKYFQMARTFWNKILFEVSAFNISSRCLIIGWSTDHVIIIIGWSTDHVIMIIGWSTDHVIIIIFYEKMFPLITNERSNLIFSPARISSDRPNCPVLWAWHLGNYESPNIEKKSALS